MPDLIQRLVATDRSSTNPHEDALRVVPTHLYTGTLSAVAQIELYDGVIICSNTPPVAPNSAEDTQKRTKILYLHCSDGKLGSRALREHFPRLPPFIRSLFVESKSPSVLFACPTGTDLSIGVALAVLCMFFNDSCKPPLNLYSKFVISLSTHRWLINLSTDNFSPEVSLASIDKALIRRRLACITTQNPDANPSRSTLQSVNAFLMPRDNR